MSDTIPEPLLKMLDNLPREIVVKAFEKEIEKQRLDFIEEHFIPKRQVKEAIEKSLAYHKNQLEVNSPINSGVAHYHNIIIDFIENELKERLGLSGEKDVKNN